MGAWIETVVPLDINDVFSVAPYVGAWIETDKKDTLKTKISGRTLRGCVD